MVLEKPLGIVSGAYNVFVLELGTQLLREALTVGPRLKGLHTGTRVLFVCLFLILFLGLSRQSFSV